MTSKRPNILSRSFIQTELPTQEDQIRGYRAMTRSRYQAVRATRRVFRRNNYNLTPEDPKRQVELLRERLHALHRRSAGMYALVVLKDTRWEDSRQIIGAIEVDLSARTQLVYMFLDMVLSIDDFHNHVKVVIQTHGYDTWQGDETGITVIPGERRSIEELERMSWNLKPSEQTLLRVPSRVAVNERLNRSSAVDPEIQGDELSDDEITPEKVIILDESSNWDDDERSGTKILVLREELLQNQQYFLDEYLPQWDDQLTIQKQRSESEWENPFAAKRAQIISKHKEQAFLTSTEAQSRGSYQPPPDAVMGPSVYLPVRQNPQPFYKPDYQFGYPQGKGNTFNGGYGEYHNSQWTLPLTWTESGVMLVLPVDPGLWSEVISIWESITISSLNNQT
ncbi:hypothetical protein Tco_0302615 [Tanacetum coccineum]